MGLKVMPRINKLIPLLADILNYSLSSEFSEDHVHIMKVNYPLNKITQVLDEKSITAAHKNSFNVDVEAQGYSDSGVSDVVEYPGLHLKILEVFLLKPFLMNIKSVQYKLAGLSKPAIQNVPGLRLYSTHPDALSLLSAKVFAERMFTFP